MREAGVLGPRVRVRSSVAMEVKDFHVLLVCTRLFPHRSLCCRRCFALSPQHFRVPLPSAHPGYSVVKVFNPLSSSTHPSWPTSYQPPCTPRDKHRLPWDPEQRGCNSSHIYHLQKDEVTLYCDLDDLLVHLLPLLCSLPLDSDVHIVGSQDSIAPGAGDPVPSNVKCPVHQSKMSPVFIYSSLLCISSRSRICFGKQAD